MEEKRNKKKENLAVFLLLLSLALVTISTTYAFFTYSKEGTKENTITTGSITFVYDEKNAAGNGINITNMFPMSDETGKALTGNNNVFNFQITGSAKGSALPYEVWVSKEASSTLGEDKVKIYLTTVEGEEETPAPLTVSGSTVKRYSELGNTTLSGKTGKTLYTGSIGAGTTGYQREFTLRMWVAEDTIYTPDYEDGTTDMSGMKFSVRVNVDAAQ